MLKWMLIGGTGIVCIGLILAWIYWPRRTIYHIHGPDSYAVMVRKHSPMHQTDHDGLVKVVDRLLAGDLYDSVWINTGHNEYEGLILERDADRVILHVSFTTHAERNERAALKDAMASLGHQFREDSSSFNGGDTEEHRVTDVEYELPKDGASILMAVEVALRHSGAKGGRGYYLRAWRDSTEPVAEGLSASYVDEGDPLAEVLKK
jgi:hypothetical protein